MLTAQGFAFYLYSTSRVCQLPKGYFGYFAVSNVSCMRIAFAPLFDDAGVAACGIAQGLC